LITDFDFDAETHRYILDGVEQPHVTGMLTQYGFTDYGDVPWRKLDRKQAIGSIVHEITFAMDEDEIAFDLALGGAMDRHADKVNFHAITDADIVPYVRAHCKFMDESDFRTFPGYVEKRMIAEVHGMRYGMTLDRAGMLAGRPTILDYKSCYAIEKSWPVQIALYALGTPIPTFNNVAPGRKFWKWERVIVWLKPDENYQLLPGGRRVSDPTIEKRDDEVALALLRLVHWKRENFGRD